MSNLSDLEKKINSELTTKIKFSEIKHEQLYLKTNCSDLIQVLLFLKNNSSTKFKQLVDITAVDYPEINERFKLVYLLLSHESNNRIILTFSINEKEIIPSITEIFCRWHSSRTLEAIQKAIILFSSLITKLMVRTSRTCLNVSIFHGVGFELVSIEKTSSR